MSDFNQLPQNPYSIEEPVKVKKKGPSKVKSFASLVAAGMVGSALTLTVAPFTTDFFQKEAAVENKASENMNQAATNTSGIVPTQTSVKAGINSTSIADIVENASKAVVGIVNKQTRQDFFSRSSGPVESGSGSGVIFRKTGGSAYIVTNNHVVEGASEIEVSFYNGEKTTAQVVGADALTDLAVIKVDAKFATHLLEIGDSSKLRPGDQVLAIGNPLGLDLSRTVTQGIVSAVNRSVAVDTSAGAWDLNVIQTDAAINPGNSGGALINTTGQLIGINSLKISESGIEGLGFAIPSNDVVPIVNEIIESGKIKRPYMGVSLANIEEVPRSYLQNLPNSVENGAIITYIDSNSAAKEAGLQVEDVIVSINGQQVKNSGDIRKYMYAHTKVGDKVTLKLYRDGKLITVALTLKSNQDTN
ncbi:S1C family serine protease [Pseudoneobacillus sp. C159]